MEIKQNIPDDFDALWALEGEHVEAGNIKKTGGRSSVAHLMLGDVKPVHAYIKKQNDYATALSRLLGRPRSVCCRERDNIVAWHALGLPTLDVLYCAQKQNPLRGILVTAALEGYVSLDHCLRNISDEARLALLQKTAQLIRRIHQAGWVHRCCYPKHIFICLDNTTSPLKMIDLEKARKSWFFMYDKMRDLSAFDRRMDWRSSTEREQFLNVYFANASTGYRRLMMLGMSRRALKKRNQR